MLFFRNIFYFGSNKNFAICVHIYIAFSYCPFKRTPYLIYILLFLKKVAELIHQTDAFKTCFLKKIIRFRKKKIQAYLG